jgi:hypothetical protein
MIERQAIRGGSFTSVRDLTGKIRQFINGWNPRSHPFIWAKPADESSIASNVNRSQRQAARSGGMD